MDKETSLNQFILNRVDDLVERHNHRFEMRLIEFESEVSGGFQTRHGNALASEFLWFQ